MATKQEILDCLAKSPGAESGAIQWGRDRHGVDHIVVQSWEAIGAANDWVNTHLNPSWGVQREVYLAAAKREHDKDYARWPNAHPSNQGPTGGPFASLRTIEGELSVVAAHTRRDGASYLVPAGVISIGDGDEIVVVFDDDHTFCGDCGVVVETQPTHHGWEEQLKEVEGSWVCLDCAQEEEDDDDADE